MKLEEEDVEWLSGNFEAINKRLQASSAASVEACNASAIALEILRGLVDKKTMEKAADKVAENIGKEAAKRQIKKPLSATEAFEKYA